MFPVQTCLPDLESVLQGMYRSRVEEVTLMIWHVFGSAPRSTHGHRNKSVKWTLLEWIEGTGFIRSLSAAYYLDLPTVISTSTWLASVAVDTLDPSSQERRVHLSTVRAPAKLALWL